MGRPVSLADLAKEVLLTIVEGIRPCDSPAVAAVAAPFAAALADDRPWTRWCACIGIDGGAFAMEGLLTGCGFWERLPARSTAPRSRRSCCAAAAVLEKSSTRSLMLHGGHIGFSLEEVLSDTWRMDVTQDGEHGEQCTWTRIPDLPRSPGARTGSDAAVLCGQYFIVHGGVAMPYRRRDSRTYILDLSREKLEWKQVEGKRPATRFHHTFTQLGHGKAVALSCGHNREMDALGDVHILECPQTHGGVWSWVELCSNGGSTSSRDEMEARAYHAAAAVGSDRVALFGGLPRRGDFPLNDLWLLEPASSSQTIMQVKAKGPLPPGRSRHGAISVGSVFIVFGGSPGVIPWDRDPLDLWSIDLSGDKDPVWSCLEFSVLQPDVPQWPRHWLLPRLGFHGGHLIAFGGYRNMQGWDCLGDPVVPESDEASGDAGGALLILPWHDIFRSKEWRVLSSQAPKPCADPVVFMQDFSPPLLLGFEQDEPVPAFQLALEGCIAL
mmetsp:Transcript_33902/g.79283  ORF Transcript_33902/g.79283 Transcript_33902/m.79283 type:complete len:496 (+) Transcript_33902:127-1614(+)|eukprot:CAMPEP_0178384960 /NCGR_PEP_ID=MMETSP0689_2-20121128/7788_1 /TAXON_ID=160604 /ORGANISM="Amphidinium massartii, Strain CS-259" /LENGTH=495 /DNA_ID=CAMNT_0020005231 /DNA_START=38 /DNA_END=1525 /DNA_ORIENTATION=-